MKTIQKQETNLTIEKNQKSNMKPIHFLLYILLASLSPLYSQSFTEWKDPDINTINTLDIHSPSYRFFDEKDLLHRNTDQGADIQSLNGKWLKYEIEELGLIQKNYLTNKVYQKNAPKEVRFPTYLSEDENQALIFDLLKEKSYSPEFLEKHNKASIYSSQFDMEKAQKEDRIFLCLEFTGGAHYVYINHQFVGYTELSKYPSEFDITQYVKAGKPNDISILSYLLSDASFLHFADDLSHFGAFQNVFLYSKPKTYIADYRIQTDLSLPTQSGVIESLILLRNESKKTAFYLETEILDKKGKQVAISFQWVQMEKNSSQTLQFTETIKNFETWTAESPNLYTLIIRIKDMNNVVMDMSGQPFGFRKVELKENSFYVNEKKIKLKGMNYNGQARSAGIAFSEEAVKKDLMIMKQNNINAIQVRNGMLPARFYELCDLYGFYVIDKANINTRSSDLLKETDWSESIEERVMGLYKAHKNHPSILAWGLGASIINGKVYEEAYKALKETDNTRIVLFEGSGTKGNTDVLCDRDLKYENLLKFKLEKATKPILLLRHGNRYANGVGGLADYWKLAQEGIIQGIFIEEFRNEGPFFEVLMNDQFKQSGEVFINKGLIGPNGEVSASLKEIKNTWKAFHIQEVNAEKGEYRISNLLDFTPLSNYRIGYIVLSNFKELGIVEGELPISAEPGTREDFKVRIPEISAYGGEEYSIRFYLLQRNASDLIPSNTELGFQDFKIETKKQERQEVPIENYAALQIEESENFLTLSSEDMKISFDKKQGWIHQLIYDKEKLLSEAGHLTFRGRPSFFEKMNKKMGSPYEYRLKEFKTQPHNPYSYSIHLNFDLWDTESQTKVMELSQSYLILASNDIILENQLLFLEKMDPYRIGWDLPVPSKFSQIQWYGKESETYVDRKEGSKTRMNSKDVNELFLPFPVAQESSNIADTRWLSLSDSAHGLYFELLDSLFQFSLVPYKDSLVWKVLLSDSILREENWILNLDAYKGGVGVGMMDQMIEERYAIKGEKFDFILHLKPYSAADNRPQTFRLDALPIIKNEMLPSPSISKSREVFDSLMLITLSSPVEEAQIFYTLNNTEPSETSLLYTKPFPIESTTTIKAKLFKKGKTPSFTTKGSYRYISIDSVAFSFEPNTPYNRANASILYDEDKGTIDLKEEQWIGFSKNDLVATVRLKTNKHIKSVNLTFAHDPDSWTFLPTDVVCAFSEDNITYSNYVGAKMPFPTLLESEAEKRIVNVTIESPIPKAKYIRIQAKNIGKIPSWHRAKGLNAWMLISEIELTD